MLGKESSSEELPPQVQFHSFPTIEETGLLRHDPKGNVIYCIKSQMVDEILHANCKVANEIIWWYYTDKMHM